MPGHILSIPATIITFAAAPLVLTPFVHSQGERAPGAARAGRGGAGPRGAGEPRRGELAAAVRGAQAGGPVKNKKRTTKYT